MVCYSPIVAYKGGVNANGKVDVVFERPTGCDSSAFHELKLPCGKCFGCLTDRSKSWAIRCLNEAQMHEDNCFVTLTYDDEHMPRNGSLDKQEFVLFMRRLRRTYSDKKIRYFHCGEYGEKLGRPHHHVLLFGMDFDDKRLHKDNFRGDSMYRSASLEKLWPFGFSLIGELNYESAGYVARYTLKKVYGDRAEEHYGGKLPEYCTMSRRPGIGKGWFDKFRTDLYPCDYGVVDGHRVKPGKYYDKLLDAVDPEMMKDVKKKRLTKFVKSVKNREDLDCFRMAAREKARVLMARSLNRRLEDL